MRTWHIEALTVAAVLVATAALTGGEAREWVGGAAVLLTFMHAQVSDRMAEREARRPAPDVPCYRWATRYYVGKEALWLLYFALSETYAALAGCLLFLAYPLWRRAYRARRPLPAPC